MSDSEDLREINADDIPGGAESQADKRRRIQRACDACRRKKIKCDGGQTADGICTSCRQLKLSCQYVEVAKKRGPPKGYIESVENRLARMERLLTRLAPGSDFTAELGARIDRVTFDLEAHKAAEPQNALSARSSRQQSPTQAAITAHGGSCSSNHVSQSYAGSPAGSSANCASDQPIKPWEQEDAAAEGDVDEDAEDEIAFIRRIKQLHVETISNEKTPPFMGPSSGIKLLETLQDYRTGMAPGGERGAGVASLFKDLNANRRRIFWDRPSWENVTFECLNHSLKREASSTWPSPALATQLIDNYFNHENIILPLLHRPIFEREFASGLAETDKNFRSLCFTVFAHGSRVSDDPEVFLKDTSPELKVYSRGWPWMNELFKIDKSWDDSSVLHELQCIVLAASFLQGSSHPRACWTMIGLGIRAVFDAGLHRRHIVQAMPPAECELSKRVFWCLYQLDRATASVMGRPVCLHDEDHDIDYPLNVDDEFWEVDEPAQQFKQPDDQPSKIAGFIALLKLSQITGYCIRTVYAINKGRISLNTVEAQQHTVAELDSALNAWLDQLPSHLKWDPHHSHDTWFLQSAMCYSVYYAAQIFVHRPFIPSSTRPSRIGFPSLAICTNAARSGAHIIDVARKRKGFSGIMELPTLGVVFTFGIVLLLNVWGGSKNGSVGDPNRAIKDVSRLLDLLSQTENRFLLAGKLKDILLQLSSQGNMPVQPVQSSSKRTREGVSRDTESASPTSVILDRNIREQPGPLPVDPSTHSNHHSQRKPSGSRSKKNSIGSIARPSHQQQLIDSNRSASMSSSMSSTAPSYDADVPPTPRPAPPSQYATFGAPPLSMSSGGPNGNNGVGGFPTAATFGGAAGMQPFPTDPAGNVTIPAWALASLTSQTGSEESNAFFSSLSMMQGLGTTPGGFNIPNQQQQQQQSSVGGSQPSSDHQQPPSYFNPVHFPVAQHVGPKVSDRIFASNGHGRSADVFVGGPGGDGQTLNNSSLSSYGPDSNSTTTATGNFSTPAPQSGSSSSFSGTQPSPGSQEWDSAALGQLGMDGLQTEEYFPDGFGINDWSAAVFNNGFTQGFATPNDGSGGPLSHNSQNGYSTGGPSSNAQCY